MKLENFLTPYTKVNSKLIIDLNIRPEITKLLEENTNSILFDIGLSKKKKMYMSPQVRETKAKVNKQDYKLKIICAKNQKDHLLNRRKYLPMPYQIKG